MKIQPTVENVATLTPAADYTVDMPSVRINLLHSKNISSSLSISGGASISIWPGSVEGERRELDVLVPQEQYAILHRIKLSGVDEWMMSSGGRVFRIVFDMPGAVRQRDREWWRCRLVIVIASEETAV
jgi:hypothetical protein